MITALLIGGCAQQQSQLSYIGADRAKQLALDAASLLSSETQSVTTDLSTRNGIDYYQVDIVADGERYRYDIDAFTGIVIDSSTPSGGAADSEAGSTDAADGSSAAATADSSDGSSAEATADSTGGSSANAVVNSTGRSSVTAVAGSSAGSSTAQELITEESAKSSALAHAGLTADQVTFTKSKLDHDDGRRVYEVEFRIGNSAEYDYEIDAYSGEIISYDYDLKDSPSSGSGSTISEEEAKSLALAQVPGASDSDIKKFKTDRDDGHIEYEGTILYDGMDFL